MTTGNRSTRATHERGEPGSFQFLALLVPDLQEAEQYYKSLFAMGLVGREALLEDGLWYTLPFDKGWEDALAADIHLGMLALRKGDIVLALFAGDGQAAQLYEIAVGLSLEKDEISRLQQRLKGIAEVETQRGGGIEFRDRFGITWQISPPGVEFQMAGNASDRWLEL